MVCRECGAYNAENLTHCRVCAARLKGPEQPTADMGPDEQQEPERPAREFVRAPSWPTRAYSSATKRPVYAPPAQKEPEPEAEPGEFEIPDEDFKSEWEKPAAEPVAPPKAPAVHREPEPAEAEPETEAEEAPVARRASAVRAPLADRKLTQPAAPAERKAPAAPAAQPAAKRFCTACGKPMIADAPFCAYCGTKNALLEEKAEEMPNIVVPAAPRREMASRKPAPAQKSALRSKWEPEELEEDDDVFEEDEKPAKAKRGLQSAKPVPPAKPAKKRPEFDEDEDEDEFDEDEDEFDEDDDDEFDDDDDERPSRGKSTTILFWGLIVLLVALIGVFGVYIVKKNYDGQFSNLVAALFGSKDNPSASETAPGTSDPGTADPGASSGNEALMGTATITEGVGEDGVTPIFRIDAYAPTGSTVQINTAVELLNGGRTTVPSMDHVILNIPQSAFMPNTPLDSTTISVTPDIVVTTPEGQTIQLAIPPVTLTAEPLTINLEQPATDVITAKYENAPITVKGTVADHIVEVYFNDVKQLVTAGGVFEGTFTPASNSETSTLTITAKKNNFVTVTKTITIEPYVEQPMSLTVTNEVPAGLVTSSGKVTISGTVTPGSKVSAACADSNITCGTVAVSSTGNYSLIVTAARLGAYEIQLTASQEGFKDTTTSVIIERWPDVRDSSSAKVSWRDKNCTKLISSLYKKIADGSTTTGDYMFTATVTEIIQESPYRIIKMKLSSGEEIVLCNRSKTGTDAGDIGKKKICATALVGLYPNTKLPYFWCWYMWNVA